MKKKILSVVLCSVICVLCACQKNEIEISSSPADSMSAEEVQAQWEEAKTTPYGKYPELVTYTLGKMTATNNSNMPQGDTYENNAYTRYLKDMLNIQNEDAFEEMDEQYYITVDMAVSAGKIPDIMIVEDADAVVKLHEQGLIQDLTTAYENGATNVIKSIYKSYGEEIFAPVTIDGKLMAIPGTSISEGPNLIWLRKDWMDKLGLEEPSTIYDVEEIVRAFVTENPGNNAPGETIGLVSNTSLCGDNGISLEYQLDILFATFGAFPKQWIYDAQGNVCYGSVQPQAKEGLAYVRSWYEEGLLDENFLLRTDTNIIDLIVDGKCGSFFGPWWAPNNPLMEAISVDPQAQWVPYLIETNADGKTYYHSQNPGYKYVVVRKGFEYPEIVCKMISVIFDYTRYEDVDNVELSDYFVLNVDPTARPIAINVDYNTALQRCYTMLLDAFAGKISYEEMPLLERSYYNACKAYMEKEENASAEEWAAYQSRIVACSLLEETKIEEVPSLFFGETESMRNSWWKLEEMENSAYLKIICGEEELSYFDTFVESWKEAGGVEITAEVSEVLEERGK